MTQLPHHRAPEPPPAAKRCRDLTPLDEWELRHRAGGWQVCLATFTHPERASEAGHGSGELSPALTIQPGQGE